MNCIIPFTKEVKFNTNIAEILSISLEHEYTVNDNELLGNFIITGEYKTHEVSVNRESFSFTLPFEVNLTKPIDKESVDFAIEDFTYKLVDNTTLKVDIEYSIKALELEVREEVFEEVSKEDENMAEEILSDVLEEKLEDEERVVAVPAMDEEVIEENITEEFKSDEKSEENVVMNAIDSSEDDFVTYHIHIMKENESIESVCTKYNTTTSVLENYNDLKNITFGDKIIVPEIDE